MHILNESVRTGYNKELFLIWVGTRNLVLSKGDKNNVYQI